MPYILQKIALNEKNLQAEISRHKCSASRGPCRTGCVSLSWFFKQVPLKKLMFCFTDQIQWSSWPTKEGKKSNFAFNLIKNGFPSWNPSGSRNIKWHRWKGQRFLFNAWYVLIMTTIPVFFTFYSKGVNLIWQEYVWDEKMPMTETLCILLLSYFYHRHFQETNLTKSVKSNHYSTNSCTKLLMTMTSWKKLLNKP